jgi:molybdopterin molybdotransferase
MSEPDVSDLVTVRQAIEMIDATRVEPRARKVSLTEAQGLYLAEDVRADRDYPAFEKSLMDGFAVRGADVEANKLELKLVGEIRAGQAGDRSVRTGEAIAIMTGAPLPAGADAVVPIEFVERVDQTIRINRPGDFKRFVARRGSDCAAGAVVLRKAMRIEAPQLAVAATIGASEVNVFEAPHIAILATGDELIDPSHSPQPHQLRNSNSIMLASLLKRYGCDVTDLGIVRDEMTPLRKAIERGVQYEAFIITGGMSVGAYDLPPQALHDLGAELLITKLKIKPGKPFIYARHNRCHIFGLPGNPLAGFVCTVRLASRLIRRMSGAQLCDDIITATLASELKPNGPREFYQPAILDGNRATPLDWKSSADVFTLAQANALLIRAENESAKSAGDSCKLIRIPT